MQPINYDLKTLESSNDLAMLTASFRRDRLLLDFRNYGEECSRYDDDRGFLVLSGEYSVEAQDGSYFSVTPYAARRPGPFYFRVPEGMSCQMEGAGIYQHVCAGPRSSYSKDPKYRPVSVVKPPIRMLRTSEEAFHTSDRLVAVSHAEIDVLKAELPATNRKRIRLCCHPNSHAWMHEMFVLYTKQTYIQPNKHLAKDETFLILEGEADFIFYTESGDVSKIIPLGTPESGKTFFVRVPQGVYHSVVMHSDYLVIHEATPGPYDREHTVWAPWAKSQKLS